MADFGKQSRIRARICSPRNSGAHLPLLMGGLESHQHKDHCRDSHPQKRDCSPAQQSGRSMAVSRKHLFPRTCCTDAALSLMAESKGRAARCPHVNPSAARCAYTSCAPLTLFTAANGLQLQPSAPLPTGSSSEAHAAIHAPLRPLSAEKAALCMPRCQTACSPPRPALTCEEELSRLRHQLQVDHLAHLHGRGRGDEAQQRQRSEQGPRHRSCHPGRPLRRLRTAAARRTTKSRPILIPALG